MPLCRSCTMATMTVDQLATVFDSWPQSVQTAFMELKKEEKRTMKAKENLENKKKFLEVLGKMLSTGFKKSEESLKQKKMKKTEALKAWKLALEVHEQQKINERREYKEWEERHTRSTQQPWLCLN